MHSALAEIHGLKYEMLTTAFRKRQYLRSLDNEFINWCGRIIDGYEDLEDTHNIKTEIREMAELSMQDRQGCELFPGESKNLARKNLDAGYMAIAHSARMFVEVADDLEGRYG